MTGVAVALRWFPSWACALGLFCDTLSFDQWSAPCLTRLFWRATLSGRTTKRRQGSNLWMIHANCVFNACLFVLSLFQFLLANFIGCWFLVFSSTGFKIISHISGRIVRTIARPTSVPEKYAECYWNSAAMCKNVSPRRTNLSLSCCSTFHSLLRVTDCFQVINRLNLGFFSGSSSHSVCRYSFSSTHLLDVCTLGSVADDLVRFCVT